ANFGADALGQLSVARLVGGDEGTGFGGQPLRPVAEVAAGHAEGVAGLVKRARDLVTQMGAATPAQLRVEEVQQTGTQAEAGQQIQAAVHDLLLSYAVSTAPEFASARAGRGPSALRRPPAGRSGHSRR